MVPTNRLQAIAFRIIAGCSTLGRSIRNTRGCMRAPVRRRYLLKYPKHPRIRRAVYTTGKVGTRSALSYEGDAENGPLNSTRAFFGCIYPSRPRSLANNRRWKSRRDDETTTAKAEATGETLPRHCCVTSHRRELGDIPSSVRRGALASLRSGDAGQLGVHDRYAEAAPRARTFWNNAASVSIFRAS